MLRRRLVLGLVPLGLVLLPAGGCQGPEAAQIGLVMRAPAGLLDTATAVQLTVFDASLAKCDSSSGHVDKLPTGKDVQQFALDRAGCPSGASWCKSITVDRDGTTKMFAIVAKASGMTIAEGCTTAPIDQDPLEVDIKVQRYNPPACCNDGTLQTGEQCEGPVAASACDGSPGDACTGIASDAVCTCDCRAQEILLSIDDGKSAPQLTNGPPKTKTQLALSFAPGNPQIGTTLRAFFRNTDAKAVGGGDINLRYLNQDLYPIQKPFSLGLQLRLPLLCSQVTTATQNFNQTSPSFAVASADTAAVVYTSDEAAANRADVYLTPQTLDGCTDTLSCTGPADCRTSCNMVLKRCEAAVRLSSPSMNPPGVDEARVSSGPTGSVLAVWTRNGGVYGRIWKTDGTMLPATGELMIAQAGSHARVSGSAKGWKVVYAGSGGQDNDAVLLTNVGLMGEVSPAARVNAVTVGPQDQPDVASLSTGAAIVVFHSGSDIFAQRFDANGAPIANDQDKPLNTTQGTLANPVAAAASMTGSFYTVAWENLDKGDITARFVDGSSGFLFNSVTGQNDEFSATLAEVVGQRTGPAIAIGGYVAIGWSDASPDHPGVFVRRFPLPSQ